MDEKLKSENMQKEQFSERGGGNKIFFASGRLRRQGGIDPPNQNPADARARGGTFRRHTWLVHI